MTLQLTSRPDRALEIAKHTLAGIACNDGFLTPSLRKPGPRRLSVSTWHRLFFLGLDRLAENPHAVETAFELGWRLFVHRDDQIVAAIEVRRTNGGGHRPGPLTEGPFVEGTLRAFQEAERVAATQSCDYEPILLMVPALHVSGLWMRMPDSSADLILPVAPIDQPFIPCKTLAVSDFESELRELAQQQYKRRLPR